MRGVTIGADATLSGVGAVSEGWVSAIVSEVEVGVSESLNVIIPMTVVSVPGEIRVLVAKALLILVSVLLASSVPAGVASAVDRRELAISVLDMKEEVSLTT